MVMEGIIYLRAYLAVQEASEFLICSTIIGFWDAIPTTSTKSMKLILAKGQVWNFVLLCGDANCKRFLRQAISLLSAGSRIKHMPEILEGTKHHAWVHDANCTGLMFRNCE